MKMTALEFAGGPPEGPEFEGVCRTLHAGLFAAVKEKRGRQAGPVTWRVYEPSAAVDMLTNAGLIDDPHATGLIDFLREEPGTVLIVGSLDYELPD